MISFKPILGYLMWMSMAVLTVPVFSQSYQNASDVQQREPLAGLRELRSSKEMYILWAQDNIYRNQVIDYLPTGQPGASLLAGDITDVFAPSQIANGSEINETSRTAVAAADMEDDGIDEIVRLTTTNTFDLLLSVTTIGSELEVTGNTITTQIAAEVNKSAKSKIQLLSGNFDADAAEEVVLMWPEGSETNPSSLEVRIIELQGGSISMLAEYSFQSSFIQYDAVLSDADINGIPEIVFVTHGASIEQELLVTLLQFENGMLAEKISSTISEFLPGEALFHDLSLALTAGDFDGDVAPELGLFIRQPYPDLSGFKVQFKALQSVDLLSSGEVDLFEDLIIIKDETLIDTALSGKSFQPIYASAGDLDGDGDDEAVLLVPPRDRLLHIDWKSEGQIHSRFFELEIGFSDPIFCFTRGGVEPLGLEIGDLNRDGTAELVYTFAEGCTEDIISDNLRGARLTCHVYEFLDSSNVRLQGYFNSNNANTQFYGVLPAAFVLGDFNGDNFRLGKGRYFRRSAVSQPVIVLNAPPIHFDQFGDALFDVNGCYNGQSCAFESSYLSSTTASMKTSTSVSSAWSASIEVEGSVTADYGVIEASVEGSVKAKYGERFSKYKSSGTRLEISTQVSAIEDDQIYATVSDYDIWEYPVYEKDSLIAHLISVTPTILENRWFPSKSFNAYDYLPDHEVGNVLSYREMRPELSSVSQTITSDAFTLSANSSNKWTINQQSFRESGSSFEQRIGLEASLKVETEAKFKVFGGSAAVTVEGDYDNKSLETHRTRISEEIEIEVSMGGVDESLGEVKYSVNPYCYWAKNGSLVVDYTTRPEVPAPGASDTWWSANYGKNADPALILPWLRDPEKGLTLQDEQVKRFQSKSVGFSNASPEAGDTITIYVEVHNWSLLPTAQPVEVGFYLCDPLLEENRLMAVNGGSTISTGEVLEPRGNQILSFQWRVPEGLPTFPRIYARIDPNDREIEIHEENNFGFNILNISTNRQPCPAPLVTNNKEKNLRDKIEVEAFPNPVSDQLTIRFKTPDAGNLTGHIYNSMGVSVLRWDSRKLSGQEHVETINVSRLTPGIYYCQILQGKNLIVTKIVRR